MERNEFEEIVAHALDDLPAPFCERLINVAVIVEDLPRPESASHPTPAPTAETPLAKGVLVDSLVPVSHPVLVSTELADGGGFGVIHAVLDGLEGAQVGEHRF